MSVNKNYKDLEQVAEFLPAFEKVYEAERAAGRYTYNDTFRGRVDGIAGECEDTAIYLLQGLRRRRATDERVRCALADGFEHAPAELAGVEKFSRIVVYKGGRDEQWQEFADARLVPETKPRQVQATGPLLAVLPKGRRVNGISVVGSKVLVRR